MKKLTRYFVLLVSLLFLMSVPLYAVEGSGTGGETGEGGSSLDGKDGASSAKTGFLIWTSDESGQATSPIVFRTFNGDAPYSTSGAPLIKVMTTRFGQTPTESSFDNCQIVWGKPPFTGSSGNGGYIKSWLCSPQPQLDVDSGAEWVLKNYLHFSDEQILEWGADENAYLNVQDVMWGGIYRGTRHMGVVLCGSVIDWAKTTDIHNYLSTYTHRNMPNGMAYDIDYLGLLAPSDISSKHDSSEILANVGYGIVSVKPVLGDKQLVQVFTTDGKVDQTSYSSCGEIYNVANRGDYKVKKWDTGKKKTKLTDIKATYEQVTSGIELVQHGSGEATVTMQPAEKALFILYEREQEDVGDRNNDSLRAHELDFVFPKMCNVMLYNKNCHPILKDFDI